MIPPIRGSATFAISTYRMTKAITSQVNSEANVAGSKGGKVPLLPDGCSVRELVAILGTKPRLPIDGLQREQQQQRDQQREDAERFGHGEPEDQVAELALRGRRVADGGGPELAEEPAAGAAR